MSYKQICLPLSSFVVKLTLIKASLYWHRAEYGWSLLGHTVLSFKTKFDLSALGGWPWNTALGTDPNGEPNLTLQVANLNPNVCCVWVWGCKICMTWTFPQDPSDWNIFSDWSVQTLDYVVVYIMYFPILFQAVDLRRDEWCRSSSQWAHQPFWKIHWQNRWVKTWWPGEALTLIQIRKSYKSKIVIIFLSINLNMCFGWTKELFHWDGSFEFPQYMFWMRNKENNFHCFLHCLHLTHKKGARLIWVKLYYYNG